MMRAALIALATMSLFMAGCGTCSDMMGGCIDDRVFYRGVHEDIEHIKQSDPALALVSTVDLPFSAVADTILVPILVPVWLNPGWHNCDDTGRIGTSAEMAKGGGTSQSSSLKNSDQGQGDLVKPDR